MQYVVTKKDTISATAENPTRTVRLWMDKEFGAKNMSVGTCELSVDGELAYHTHDAEELMFVYKGTGEAVVGGQTFAVGPETLVFAPPGVEHKFKNTGSEPLVFTFSYAPPGTEQAIREWAEKQ